VARNIIWKKEAAEYLRAKLQKPSGPSQDEEINWK